jgi:hypothetical protein
MKREITRFLSDTQFLVISPHLACIVGLNEAIVLQQLRYWMERSGHERDGAIWIYNTMAEWNSQFPFFSLSTLRRAFESLESKGVIRSSKSYNRMKMDQTKWYSIDFEVVHRLESEYAANAFAQNEQMELLKMNSATAQNGQMTFVQNGQMLPETTEITSETTQKEGDASRPSVGSHGRNETETAKGTNENHVTELDTVPGAGALPAYGLMVGSDAFKLMTIYNFHRGAFLRESQSLTSERERKLKVLLKTYGFEAAASLVADATREAARTKFWEDKGWGLTNLLRTVVEKAEAWRGRTPAERGEVSETPGEVAAPVASAFTIGQRVSYRRYRYTVKEIGATFIDLDDEENGSTRVYFATTDFDGIKPVQ